MHAELCQHPWRIFSCVWLNSFAAEEQRMVLKIICKIVWSKSPFIFFKLPIENRNIHDRPRASFFLLQACTHRVWWAWPLTCQFLTNVLGEDIIWPVLTNQRGVWAVLTNHSPGAGCWQQWRHYCHPLTPGVTLHSVTCHEARVTTLWRTCQCVTRSKVSYIM